MVDQQLTPKNCPSFEGCKAPVCPIDASFRLAIWYPSEPICGSLKFCKELWRKAQKKISKLDNIHQIEGFFTETALNKIKIVRKGINGVGCQ